MKMDEGNLEIKFPLRQYPVIMLSVPEFSQVMGTLQWSSYKLPLLELGSPLVSEVLASISVDLHWAGVTFFW